MSDNFYTEFMPFISLYKTQLDEFKTYAVSRNRSIAKDRLETMLTTLKEKISYSFDDMNSQMMRNYKKLVSEFENELSSLS